MSSSFRLPASSRARHTNIMKKLLQYLLLVCSSMQLTSAAVAAVATPASAGKAAVMTAQELLSAMSDPSVSVVTVMKPFSMPHVGLKPAVVHRQLLVTSPFRATINWCDEQCIRGNMSATPFITLGKGAMVTFNRLFFKNFVAHTSSAQKHAALDFLDSPVPWIVSRDGGQATYSLVVMHWTRPMFWVFKQQGTFWQQAGAEEIRSVGAPQPLQLEKPELYVVKSFTSGASTASITDCYMPLDVDGCLTNQTFDTTLVYCPYTFKDSLRNPWVSSVVVFHDIGLDRLVNSYRNPVVVNRTVVYSSCPGTQRFMDLDNITDSVVVAAGGSMTLRGLTVQKSKSNNKTDWPSRIPLLLSTFRPVQSGTIILRDSVVRVTQMDSLVRALGRLPSGSSGAVENPDLQPKYANGTAPKPGADSFNIKAWQLQRQRWLLSKAGGNIIMDKVGSTASWQFFNVTVVKYTIPDCFGAAVVQGSATPGSYSTVRTGQQLLDQLANSSARYIQVMNDLTLPARLDSRLITVSRIVEVRSCTPGAPYVIDWADNHDAVVVTGNCIWQGNMVFRGLGLTPNTLGSGDTHLVGALHPAGTGSIEYEDLSLEADISDSSWGPTEGQATMSQLLGVQGLDDQPLNVTLLEPHLLLLRAFFLNRSQSTNGVLGVESYIDVMLGWTMGPGSSESSGLSQAALLAAIICPIIVASLLLGTVLACLYYRHTKSWDPASKKGHKARPALLPCFGIVQGPSSGGAANGTAANGTAVKPRRDFSGSSVSSGLPAERDGSSLSAASSNRSKAKLVFDADIAQARRTIVTSGNVRRDDELFLESVIGEGSYGKVFKATWRGTVVAVKIMVLPQHMTGKQKREKMAIMETAISSSLSHPNCVQTYTYTVEPVLANSDINVADGRDRALALQGTTMDSNQGHSWKDLSAHSNDAGSGSSEMSSFSWEIRLVQEYCDLGSLGMALKQGKFRSTSGAVHLPHIATTALDVARAMAHLHQHNILHSDLKAGNVLLRTDGQDPRGFVAKVADFGLSLTIDPNCTHVSNAYQGTMTHMAPETLMHGHVSRASDVFAFGILMWELITGGRAYKGIPRALLGHNITKEGMRPEFPASAPFEWQFLACRCWESDPAIRPSFDQILEELKRMESNWRMQCDGSEVSSGVNHPLRVNSNSTGTDSQAHLANTDGSPASELSQGVDTSQHKGAVSGTAVPQQHVKRQPGPVAPVPPCLNDQSREALVLLSDCGSGCATLTTLHDLRDSAPKK